jgi:DNA (cytosine-5)-methyltransferase 1
MREQTLTFIDLFAGIGGFHLAFDGLKAECVFASEKDAQARKTYQANFEQTNPALFEQGRFNDDIVAVHPATLPDFDILCAGFPCQPFSQAGYKKGFLETREGRGNMFFVIRDIVKAKRPKALFLENVRHLLNHDGGRTFKIIKEVIEKELGYTLHYKVIKASDYGLPQHRARLFMIAFDAQLSLKTPFHFPQNIPLKYTMSDVFGGVCEKDIGFTLRVGGRGSKIDDRRNWEFYRVDGAVKRIGIDHAKKMMGLPDSFIFPVSETQAMKQLGNSVAVDAVRAVGGELVRCLRQGQGRLEMILNGDVIEMRQTLRSQDISMTCNTVKDFSAYA